MTIQALGYLGLQATDRDTWTSFGARLLGLQVAEHTPRALRFRMDERAQRLAVVPGDHGGLAYAGWEVADGAALRALAARLDAHGVAATWMDEGLRAERAVGQGIVFADPVGNRLEAFCDQQPAGRPFSPGRNISGFVTGTIGMGHLVLPGERIDGGRPFYEAVLGFRRSPFIRKPFHAYFFHVNPRHHSLALIETGRNGVHHMMLELNQLDDVGQGYDLALTEETTVSTTLGRHTNDYMTSFYAKTPSGLLVEYGWGGRWIDPAAWQPIEMTSGPSLWGHERTWLPHEGRVQALNMRLELAERGERAPVQVAPGNYQVSPVPRADQVPDAPAHAVRNGR